MTGITPSKDPERYLLQRVDLPEVSGQPYRLQGMRSFINGRVDIGWFDASIDFTNLAHYLKDPDTLIADLTYAVEENKRIRADLDYYRQRYKYRGGLRLDYTIDVLKGLVRPCRVAPWYVEDDSDKYLTLHGYFFSSHESEITHYIKLSEHERLLNEAHIAATSSIREIVQHEVSRGIHEGVATAIKNNTATLSQIESEKKRLQYEQDKINRQMKRLEDAEEKAREREANKPEPKPREVAGFVYLVKSLASGHYKIGHTKDIKDRLRTFSVKLPFEIELEHTIECVNRHEAERSLHQRFHDKRVAGEWFNLTDEDIQYIKSIDKM